MPKTAVTGGAGFIGAHVVDLFPEQGWCPRLSLEEGLEMIVAYFRKKEQAV